MTTTSSYNVLAGRNGATEPGNYENDVLLWMLWLLFILLGQASKEGCVWSRHADKGGHEPEPSNQILTLIFIPYSVDHEMNYASQRRIHWRRGGRKLSNAHVEHLCHNHGFKWNEPLLRMDCIVFTVYFLYFSFSSQSVLFCFRFSVIICAGHRCYNNLRMCWESHTCLRWCFFFVVSRCFFFTACFRKCVPRNFRASRNFHFHASKRKKNCW